MKAQIKSTDSGYPLITRERTEKLELLNHLVSNLAHVIVICGPEGVGKTRMLKNFHETTKESWIFCWLTGNNQLKLDKVQEALSESIVQAMPDLKSLSLANAFNRIDTRNNKIVLVIDDAGNLPPGLIEQIIAYAERKPVLRVILALTHSEIYLKNGTDPAVDDCYQIDIPPLSEKECGDFLEYLSTLSNPRIQFSAINESRVAALYSETHGIPGNILAQLPEADNTKEKDYSKLALIGGVIGLIVLALGVQWWSGQQTTAENKAEKDSEKQQAEASINPAVSAQVTQPEPASQPTTEKPAGSLIAGKSTDIRNDVIDSLNQVANNQDLGQDKSSDLAAELPSQPSVNNEGQLAENTGAVQAETVAHIPEDEGGRWLLSQPVEHYTLQLMALSNEQAIIEVMQRHQVLGQNLKYLKTKTRTGRDRFVLLYGSFPSPEQAKNESNILPKELQKYWMRQMGAIQSEIGTALPTDTPG